MSWPASTTTICWCRSRTPSGHSRYCTNSSQPTGSTSRPRSSCCATSSQRTVPPSSPSQPRRSRSRPSPGCRSRANPKRWSSWPALLECEEYLPEFSVVAELDGEVVGHVISTRDWVGELAFLGLGLIGVVPRLQRHGIGSALMKETLARANAAGERGIALLGGPEYYSRFGFVASTSLGVEAADPAWGGHFQLLRLPSGRAASAGRSAMPGPSRSRRCGGIPLTGRPSSPIGRGSGLKNPRVVGSSPTWGTPIPPLFCGAPPRAPALLATAHDFLICNDCYKDVTVVTYVRAEFALA